MRASLLSGAAGVIAGLGAVLVAVCSLAGAGFLQRSALLALGSALGIGLSLVGSMLLLLEALAASITPGRALSPSAVRRIGTAASAALCISLIIMFAAGTVWAVSMHADKPGLVSAAICGLGLSVLAGARLLLRSRVPTPARLEALSIEQQWDLAWNATEGPAVRKWPWAVAGKRTQP